MGSVSRGASKSLHPSVEPSRAQAPRRPGSAAGAARRRVGTAKAAPAGDGEGERLVVDVSWEPKLSGGDASTEGVDPSVLEAFKRAQAAVAAAEELVETVQTLPSARLPTAWDAAWRAVKPALQALAVLGACAAMHSFSAVAQVGGGLLMALGIGLWGYRRSSLSGSGALMAVLVGWATLASSFRAGLTLLAFFFSSSKLTKLGDGEKAAVDEGHKAGGQRDWRQVACNGLAPAALAAAAAVLTGGMDAPLSALESRLPTALYGAFMGYFAACCGDTWASELGQLSAQEPRLVTSLRPVRRGTNGGVTLLGLAASLGGGALVGGVFYAAGVASPTGNYNAAVRQWALLPLGVAAGLVGSLVDSVLGATVQFSGYNRASGKITGRPGPDVTPISGLALLDNNGVNAVAALATAALSAAAFLAVF